MLDQMLAPRTRRTERRECLCGVASLRNENFHANGLQRLLTTFPESDRAIAPSISTDAKNAAWRVAIDVRCAQTAWKRACWL